MHEYGEKILELITVPKGSYVVDLGCGNGALSAKLAEKYRITGIDSSYEMLQAAKKSYPDIDFVQADAGIEETAVVTAEQGVAAQKHQQKRQEIPIAVQLILLVSQQPVSPQYHKKDAGGTQGVAEHQQDDPGADCTENPGSPLESDSPHFSPELL